MDILLLTSAELGDKRGLISIKSTLQSSNTVRVSEPVPLIPVPSLVGAHRGFVWMENTKTHHMCYTVAHVVRSSVSSLRPPVALTIECSVLTKHARHAANANQCAP